MSREADCQHQAKGKQTSAYEMPPARTLVRLDLPDTIQIGLQFGKDGGRADNQGDDSQAAGQRTLLRFLRALQHALERPDAVFTDQSAGLLHDCAVRDILAEDQRSQRNHDDEQGRDGKYGVVGQGGTHARRVIVLPVLERRSRHLEQVFEVHRFAFGVKRLKR